MLQLLFWFLKMREDKKRDAVPRCLYIHGNILYHICHPYFDPAYSMSFFSSERQWQEVRARSKSENTASCLTFLFRRGGFVYPRFLFSLSQTQKCIVIAPHYKQRESVLKLDWHSLQFVFFFSGFIHCQCLFYILSVQGIRYSENPKSDPQFLKIN